MMITLHQHVLAKDEPAESIEFLEFLGSGVTVEQEFLDPMNYSEIDSESLSDKQTDAAKENRKKDDE